MGHRQNTPPPFLVPGQAVVLFDGTCKLCNGWARFVIAHDRGHRIQLATVQSVQGQQLLAWAGLPTRQFNTIVMIEDNRFYVRSDAMFQIMAKLPPLWRWVQIMSIVPRGLRDWMYDKIAVNRYRLFGQYDCIQLPAADHEQRFLKTADQDPTQPQPQ